MRRSNGAGGIFKLSGNRRKPWIARITVGWDDNGKQLYKTVGYFETKAEAEIAVSLDKVMPVADNANIMLKELFTQWKATRAYRDLSKQTRDNYDAAYKVYMREYHNSVFKNLRLAHFQSMVDKAAAMGKSHSTMTKIKTLAVILSNYANSQDIIIKSYASQVRLPKEVKKQIPTFTETEIQTLFKNDNLPLVDTVLIMIFTGMRITELLTLTKFNIDIKNMIITGGIKTEAGTDRIIPIHPKIQKYIKARYAESSSYLIEYEKEVGSKKKGTKETVLSPYRYEHYCDIYYETLKQLGIRRLSPHKARHTFFTMLSDKCKDRKAMALIGGHTDPNFTEKTYVQPDIERLKKAIETL